MVFLIFFFLIVFAKKVIMFEKSRQNSMKNYPQGKKVYINGKGTWGNLILVLLSD